MIGNRQQIYSQLLFGFLLKGILSDGLESLLDIDSLLSGSLKVRNIALGLAPCHGTFLSNLQRRHIRRETSI